MLMLGTRVNVLHMLVLMCATCPDLAIVLLKHSTFTSTTVYTNTNIVLLNVLCCTNTMVLMLLVYGYY